MKAERFIYIFCITISLIGVINSASTTGKVTTRNTPPRTTGRSTPRTSPAPRYTYCYSCQYLSCPVPFRYTGAYVTREVSYSGYCVKIADSTLTNSRASRGVGGNYCYSRGCSWQVIGGVSKYVCCCYGNTCNSAISTSKLNIFILFLTISVTTFIKRNF